MFIHTSEITSISFSPSNEDLLLSASLDNSVKLTDIKENSEIVLLEDDSLDLISHVQFDKNSNLSFALLNNETIVFWDLKRGLEVNRISKNKKICHLTYNPCSNRIYFSNIDDIQELKIIKYEEFLFKEINQSFISNKLLLTKQKKIITFNSKNIYVWLKSKNYKKDYNLYFSFEETKLQKINDICLAPSENLIAVTDSQIINFYKISVDFKQFTFANSFVDLQHKFTLNFRSFLFSKTSLFFSPFRAIFSLISSSGKTDESNFSKTCLFFSSFKTAFFLIKLSIFFSFLLFSSISSFIIF